MRNQVLSAQAPNPLSLRFHVGHIDSFLICQAYFISAMVEPAEDSGGNVSTSSALRERGNAFYKKSQLIEGE